jgi:hypothetical protein
VITPFARVSDERDWALLAEVFNPDVVVDYSTGTHLEGREAVVAGLRAALQGSGPSQHLIGNHVVEIEGGRARSSCYVRTLIGGAPGGPFAGRTYELVGEYHDELIRTPRGLEGSEPPHGHRLRVGRPPRPLAVT